MTNFLFVQGPIPSDTLVKIMEEAARDTRIGGHSFFLGQVRADECAGSVVKAIEYTAYEEMAAKVAESLLSGLEAKYDIRKMVLIHSLGLVSVGELSLLVYVGAAHRQPAMDACRELLERLKKELPVWGREWLENEATNWKVNT